MKEILIFGFLFLSLGQNCKCELVSGNGLNPESYKCNIVEDFDGTKCIITTSLGKITALPKEVKELIIATNEIDFELSEGTHIQKLVFEDGETEIKFKGDGYVSIDLIKSEDDIILITSVSMEIANSQCPDISFNILSDAIVKYNGNKLDEVTVQGVLQLKNEIEINDLIMQSNGYVSFYESYKINKIIMESTEFIISTDKVGNIENIDTKQLDLSDANIDICLIKSFKQQFPVMQLPPNLKHFELAKCCGGNEIHLKRKNAKIRCTVVMCSLGKELDPKNCFEITEKSTETIPISVTLTNGFDLEKIKGKKIYQLIIPEEVNAEINGDDFEEEEVIIQGEAKLKGMFESIVAQSVILESAEVHKLNIISRVVFNNVKLSGFIDVTDSEMVINGPVTFENAQIIASSVNIHLNNKGSILMSQSQMVLSSGTIHGDFNGNFKGWFISKSKIEMDGAIDVDFEGGKDDICKQFIYLSESDLTFSISPSGNTRSTLVLDTSKTGLYACYDYNFKPIYTLENCKVSTTQKTIPEDTSCACEALFCNYLAEENTLQISEDVGGIEGKDLTISGNGVVIGKVVCSGDCVLVGDLVVENIKQIGGILHLKGQVTLHTIVDSEQPTIIIVEPLAVLTLQTQIISNTKLYVKDRGVLELTSNTLDKSYIEIEDTAVAVVYDSNLIVSTSVISLSNEPHNAFALGPSRKTDFGASSSTISFSKDSSLVVRGHLKQEGYLVYAPKGSIMNVPTVYEVLDEIPTEVDARIKCGTYIVARPFKDDVVCPKQPFNMRGVSVVLIPKRWNQKHSYLMMIMFSVILTSGVLAMLFVIVSLIRSSQSHSFKSN